MSTDDKDWGNEIDKKEQEEREAWEKKVDGYDTKQLYQAQDYIQKMQKKAEKGDLNEQVYWEKKFDYANKALEKKGAKIVKEGYVEQAKDAGKNVQWQVEHGTKKIAHNVANYVKKGAEKVGTEATYVKEGIEGKHIAIAQESQKEVADKKVKAQAQAKVETSKKVVANKGNKKKPG